MFQFLEKQKYPVILTAFGFLLVIISHFEVKDIAKLQILKAANPIYQLYGLGIVLLIISEKLPYQNVEKETEIFQHCCISSW